MLYPKVDYTKKTVNDNVIYLNLVKKAEPESAIIEDLNLITVIPGKKVLAGKDQQLMVSRMKELKAEIEEKEKEYNLYKHHVCTFMQDAEAMTDGINDLSTWKDRTANRVDMKVLKERYLDVYKECLVTSLTRTFLLKK